MLVRLCEKERILYHSIALPREGGQISYTVPWLMWEIGSQAQGSLFVQNYSMHDIKVTHIIVKLGH